METSVVYIIRVWSISPSISHIRSRFGRRV